MLLISRKEVMGYHSERFEVGEQTVLGELYSRLDTFNDTLTTQFEVMSGSSYRRRVNPESVKDLGFEPNYLLQTVLGVEDPRMGLPQGNVRGYLEYCKPRIQAVCEGLEEFGAADIVIIHDEGGLHGWDPSTTVKNIFGTGKTETEILHVYTPWSSVKWNQAGKSCMFFCGLNLPRNVGMTVERHDYLFSGESALRDGFVIFKPTPAGLKTW